MLDRLAGSCLGGLDGEEPVGLDRVGETFEEKLAGRFDLGEVAEFFAGELADDDLAAGGTPAEAGGEIHAFAEDGVVHAIGGAHVAGKDGSAGEADADLDLILRGFVESGAGLKHGQGAAGGIGGVVAVTLRSTKVGHDGVADELIHDAMVGIHDLGKFGHVFVEQMNDLGGVHVLSQGGEATDVAEEDGGVTHFPTEHDFAAHEFAGDIGIDDEVEDVVIFVFEGEALGHLIEGGREGAEFVAAADGDFHLIVAGLDFVGAGDEFADGNGETVSQEEAGEEGEGKSAGSVEDDFGTEVVLGLKGGGPGVETNFVGDGQGRVGIERSVEDSVRYATDGNNAVFAGTGCFSISVASNVVRLVWAAGGMVRE